MTKILNKNDLRIVKTHRILLETLPRLLEYKNFRRTTVNDLCEEAQISRATFYAHFNDKYDLLKYCLENIKLDVIDAIISKYEAYGEMEQAINQYIGNNKAVMKHLLNDADNETLIIVFEFILSISNIDIKKNIGEGMNPQYVVLSNIIAGGMISYLTWQVNNKFPPEVPVMNKYLYETVILLRQSGREQNTEDRYGFKRPAE